jgi:CRISPR-associated protein Csm4
VNLYSLRLIPESPWMTPWQSDTLSGLLCWMAVRIHGTDFLKSQILEPALNNHPRFILSDAFPSDYLPIPFEQRHAERPAEDRKKVKKAKWLKREDFVRAQRRERIPAEEMIAAAGIHSYTQLRNNISRGGENSSRSGGLFPKNEWTVGKDIPYLTVYARIEANFVDAFRRLMFELSTWGFGADASAGKGQFHIQGDLEPGDWLDEESAETSGCIVLSTFQPAVGDPPEGFWDAFTKYGKLGPDFGIENVFKRPLVMLRPGATFETTRRRSWLGRAIPMQELVSPDISKRLEAGAAHVCHLAFGLCVPMYASHRKQAVGEPAGWESGNRNMP